MIACHRKVLKPYEGATPNRELVQIVWTARLAMLVMRLLPLIALMGFRSQALPQNALASGCACFSHP
jgi:hypothetical protein